MKLTHAIDEYMADMKRVGRHRSCGFAGEVDASVTKPRLLDLFSGAGGCARGYQHAGFHVTGVDLKPQPRYAGDEFVQGDALEFIREHGHEFDAIHASPPCQGYANVTRWRGSHDDHPQLIEPVRELLQATGIPYVIENVRTTELRPCVVLCGSMFGLPVRRHRGFETSYGMSPLVLACHHRSTDLAFEHKHERAYADAMGCDWMTAREAREAIPPAFTEFIGHSLLQALAAGGALVGANTPGSPHTTTVRGLPYGEP